MRLLSLARLPRWVRSLAVLGAFIGLSCLLFLPMFRPGLRAIQGGTGDPGLFLFWLRWAPFSVAHGLNPLFTHYIDAPRGADAMWNTSMLPLGWLLAPVTLLWGAVVSFDLACVLGPALTAWTASIWLRRHTGPLPALVGGLVAGFNPFLVAQSRGHLQLIWLVLVPVILMLVEDVLWRRDSAWRVTAPLLGLAVAVQFMLSEEVLAITAVGVALLALVVAIRYPHRARTRLRVVLPAAAVAGVVSLALLAIPLANQFSPAQVLRGEIQPARDYGAQPIDLVAAARVLLLHTHHSAEVAARVVNSSENGLYVGWALLAVLACLVIVLRRRPGVVPAALLAVAFVVLSLGPRVHLAKHRYGAPLPWGIVTDLHVPGLQNVLPVRFALAMWLAVAFLVAVGVQWSLTRSRWQRVGLTGLLLLALLPLLPGLEPAGVPVQGAPAALSAVPAGSTVMVAPMAIPFADSALLWQVETGLRFRQLGSYALIPGPGHRGGFYPVSRVLARLFALRHGRVYSGPLTAHLRAAALAELRASGATLFVAVDPRQDALARWLLGQPGRPDRGSLEWSAPWT